MKRSERCARLLSILRQVTIVIYSWNREVYVDLISSSAQSLFKAFN